VLAVSTTNDQAVMDTYAMLKLAAAGSAFPAVRLIVNGGEGSSTGPDAYHRIAHACFRFLGQLVPAAAPSSDPEAMRELARNIAQEFQLVAPPPESTAPAA
jgi:hypothetical protein